MIKQTLLKRELFVRGPKVFGSAIFCVVLLLIAVLTLLQPASKVAAATNNNLNFQARLQTNTGALVPDGYYNIEFKIYNVLPVDGGETPLQGGCTTNPGAVADEDCLWSETYYDSNGVTAGNDNRVRVKNGYLTVNLGSQTAFPSTINWDQDLYISMRVGGSTQTATPTWDAEMSPRLKLTGVPYAFRAGQLAKYNSGSGFTGVLQFQNTTGGNQVFEIPDQGAAGTYTLMTTAAASGSFVQFAPSSAQVDALNNSSIFINKTSATGNLIQMQRNGVDTFTVSNSGALVAVGVSAGSGLLQGTGGLTLTGTVSINNNNNSNASINTGTSTGLVSVGGGSGTFALDTTNIDISSAGAISGTTGYTQASGNFDASASAGTFATSTGNVSLNGDTSVASGKTFTANGTALFKNNVNNANAFSVQNVAGSNLINVDTTPDAANVVTNPSFEVDTSGWTARAGTANFQRVTTQAYSGGAALSFDNDASGDGANYAVQLSPSTTYFMTFFIRSSSGTNSTIRLGYAHDGSDETTYLSGSGQTFTNNGWTKYFYGFTTPGSVAGNAYFFITSTSSTARTFYIDNVSIAASGNASLGPLGLEGKIQLGGVITSPTILRNSVDSTSAFAIQNSGTSMLFNADTLNSTITIGNNNTTSTAKLFVVTTSLPGIVVNQSSTSDILRLVDNSGTATSVFTVADEGLTTIRTLTNDANGFRVQNASSNEVFTVDTSAAQIVLGKASTLTGKQIFQNGTNANTVTLQSGVTSASYTLTLPTAGAAGSNYCLVDTNGSGVLGFVSCATGNNGSYIQLAPNSAQVDSSTNSSIFINKTGGSGNLVQMQNNGVDVFTVSNTGALVAVGVNSGSGLLQGTGGLTLTGTTSINNNNNSATNINTGTSTGLVTIGGGSGTFSLQTTNIDISNAGAITGATGLALASGNFSQTGAGTFGTGTGAVSLNGATTIAANRNVAITAGTGTFTQTYNAATATTAHTLNLTNGSATQTNGMLINRNAASGTTTNLLNLTNTAGTATHGLTFTGTFATNLINAPNFTVSNAGAVTAVGVNAGSGLLQGTGGLTITGTTSVNNNNNSATSINTGTSTGLVSIGGGAGTFALDTTNIDISAAGAITGATGLTLASGNFLQNGGGTFGTGTGAVSLNGNTTVTAGNSLTVAAGTVAFQKGSDFSTTGTTNDANLGNSALVRLTGASAQTITGIAGGVDGRLLTIVNAGSATSIISNNSGSSTAANRITTGTGGDINLTVGASISLVYDSTASLWRVTGASAATGGAGVNTIGTFNGATSYANGAQISGTTLTFGAADASNPGMVSTAAQTFAGDKTFNGQIIGAAGISSTGGAVSLTGNAASSLTTTSGALTLTSAAAATWSTTAGNLTLQAGSGTVSLGTSTNLTASGALTLTSGASTALTLDSGTSGTLSIGTTNATAISVGTGSGTFALNTANIDISSAGAISGVTGFTQASGNFDASASTGTFATSTGNVSLNGDTSVASGKTFTANGTALFKNNVDSATAFQIQNAVGTNIVNVDTVADATNLITNPSFEVNTTGWAARGATANFQRITTQYYTGAAALSFDSSAIGHGANYPIQLSPSTGYTFFVFMKAASGGSANAMRLGYAADGSDETTLLSGAVTYNSNGWYRVRYDFTTPGSVAGNAYLFITSTSATARTFYIDTALISPTGTGYPLHSEGKIHLNGVITSPTFLRNTFDSTNAFEVQTAAGVRQFAVDTANGQVTIGNIIQSTGTASKLYISSTSTIGLTIAHSATTSDGANISLNNSSGTQVNGLLINRSTAGGTTTNLLNLTQTNGTATNAISISSGTFTTGLNLNGATFTNLIDSANFDVSNAGAVTAVGVNAGTGLLQGTGGLTLTGTTSVNNNNNSTTSINTGTSTGLVSIGGGAGTFALDTTNIDISSAGAVSGVTGLTLVGAANLATQRNTTDFTTTGSSNDVNLGTGSLFRLNGASAQTITGLAGGADGRRLTIVNAAAQAATISNDSGSSVAANRITTGTGADLTVPAGGSIELVYDSSASLWRVVSGAAVTGGGANQQLSNLSGVSINASLTPNADNTLDLGSSGSSWRSLYADTSVLTPNIDVASAGVLGLGNTTATSVSICNSANCDTISIGSNADADAITIGDSTDTVGINGTVGIVGATTLTSGTTGQVPLTIQGIASQTANLVEVKNQSGGTTVLSITAEGTMAVQGIQPATTAANGTSGGIHDIKASTGGNTTGTFNSAGNGGGVNLTGGNGGVGINGGIVNGGNGGSIFLQGGIGGAGVGGGATGVHGNILLQASDVGYVGIRTTTNNPVNPLTINDRVEASSTGTNDTLAQLMVFMGGSNANKGIVAQGRASQTGNLFEGQNSAGSALFSVSAAGAIVGVGVNSGSGLLQGTGGLTLTGTTSINNNNNSATNINTGTSTGLVSIGGGSGTFALNTTNIDISSAGAISGVTGLTLINTADFVTQRNTTDFTTIGSSNDVNLGTGSLFRLNGASAQTITGLTGGADGRRITLVNAAAQAATINNDSASSTAANRIITGTGGNLTLPAGGSIELVYDSGASRWRVVSAAAISGGGANQQLSNLSGVSINASLTPNADNTLDLGSSGSSWRTLYADTSVLTPNVDVASAGALGLGNATATSVSICNSANCDTIGIGSNADADAITIGDSTDTIGINGTVTVAGATSINTTGNSATLIGNNTSSGGVTLAAGSGNVNFDAATAQFTESATARTLTVATRSSANVGTGLNVRAGTGNGANAGGVVTLQGGTGGATGGGGATQVYGGDAGGGNTNGGNVVISGGNEAGSGTPGSVIIKPQTGNDSTTAFQVQNASGTALMNVNTTSNAISLLSTLTPDITSWTDLTGTPLTAARSSHALTYGNGYVYAIGGGSNTTTYYSKVNSDGTLAGWATTTTISGVTTGTDEANAVFLNGYVYYIGGSNGGTAVTTVIYAKQNADGTLGSWMSATGLPNGRLASTVMTAYGNIYVLGGTSGTPSTSVYHAKPGADGTITSWTTSGNTLPFARHYAGGTSVNGVLYVVGGADTSFNSTNTVFHATVNPITGAVGSWTNSGSTIPAARTANVVYAANGYLYSTAGENSGVQNQTYYSRINSNGTLNAWGTLGSTANLPVNNAYGKAFVTNGYVYLVGGYNGTTEVATVYSSSFPRVQVGGNLDLLGLQGANMNDGSDGSSGAVGGSIAAGNIRAAGVLEVAGAALINGGAVIAGNSVLDAVSVNSFVLNESGSTRTIGVQTRTSTGVGTALTVSAGGGNGSSAGGVLTLQGGNSGASGNVNGGNVNITGGTGNGTGARGLVVIDTPTVNTTTTDANCGATTAVNCTIAAATVNNTSSVIVGASASNVTISMPDPTITTAGRIFYFTAANASQDFTLSLNGGGVGNTIAMRQNTTATLIWNGSDWTAAGASSSTTLQSAYDSTLSSAGGAEIVLNNTASSNGLTIRNNATSPIAGGLLEIQTSIGSNLFSVNNNATEYANNGGAESSTFTMWTGAPAGGTVSQSTTAGTMATGTASVSVVTTTTSHGAENTLTTTLTNNLQYTVSFTAKAASASFSTLDVIYSRDGTNTSTTSCATGKTVTTAIWTRVSCTFTAPASGITAANSIFIRQSDGTGRTFYVDNLSVTVNASTNHAADGSVDSALGTNWTAYDADGGAGTTTPTRDTSTIYDSSGSVQDVTTAHVNLGVRNNMPIVPSVSTQYLVSFYARSSNTFNDIRVGFLPAGGNGTPAAAQLCSDYNTQTVGVGSWTKITCIITTPSSGITDPDLVIYQPTATARTFHIDALTISLNTNTASNVQVGGGSNGGPATLFTLDRSATAPIAANNDAYLGSMYYDITTGRIQCYEADGWGACGAAPDTSVTLTPEYTGAVLNGTGIGTLTADFCSNQAGVLSVNTSFCASGLSRNYYKWTSPQATQQTYSIYVSYKLPSTFKAFNDDSTINLTALTDSTSNGAVTYEVFRSNGSAVSRCYDGATNETAVTSSINTWQTVGVNGNEATSCGFSANDNVIFKINVKAQNNANVYVENLSFTYTNK